MKSVLLDSDIVIGKLRGQPDIAAIIDDGLEKGDSFSVTPITWAEVLAGMRRHEQPQTLLFFKGVHTIPITMGIGQKAGGYLRRFGKSHGVKIADALIAAAAAVENIPLFTLNKKHYPMDDIVFYG